MTLQAVQRPIYWDFPPPLQPSASTRAAIAAEQQLEGRARLTMNMLVRTHHDWLANSPRDEFTAACTQPPLAGDTPYRQVAKPVEFDFHSLESEPDPFALLGVGSEPGAAVIVTLGVTFESLMRHVIVDVDGLAPDYEQSFRLKLNIQEGWGFRG